MTKRLPKPPAETRPAIPEFTPVPRRYRHDGWTPERQRAFIEVLADTGCVDHAARAVNIAQTNAYALRRAPGAEGFRRAWDAALDCALPRLKAIAFERSIEGQLVPVFSGGKLMGFQRKRNDNLLMFVLRHYGQDGAGRRTTINYFSSRATAGAGGGAGEGAAAGAEASTTTVRTVITGGSAGSGGSDPALAGDAAAAAVSGFEGVTLDRQAQAEIERALEACAARARALEADKEGSGPARLDALAQDGNEAFVRVRPGSVHYLGTLEPPVQLEDEAAFARGERPWTEAGSEVVDWVPVGEAEAEAGAEAEGAAGASRE